MSATEKATRVLMGCPPCPRCGTTNRFMHTEHEPPGPEQYVFVECPKCHYKFYQELEER